MQFHWNKAILYVLAKKCPIHFHLWAGKRMWFINALMRVCMWMCWQPAPVRYLFFSHQIPCHLTPGLNNKVRSYTLSVNKETVEQDYVCTNNSDVCSYTWNVADNDAVNYMVSVAANNVVGQSVRKNCTTTPVGEQLYLSALCEWPVQ